MANEVTTSKQFSVNWKDIAKGLLMAVLTPVVLVIQQSLSLGVITFNWRDISMAAIAGGIAYIVKNFFTPAQTVITGTPQPTQKEAEEFTDPSGQHGTPPPKP